MMNNVKDLKKNLLVLEKQQKELAFSIQLIKRQIRTASESASININRHKARVHIRAQAAKQDTIVNALRSIGKPTTAGPICNELKKIGLNIHNSEFSQRYVTCISSDPRIIINKINASKYEYSLREWVLNK